MVLGGAGMLSVVGHAGAAVRARAGAVGSSGNETIVSSVKLPALKGAVSDLRAGLLGAELLRAKVSTCFSG